MEIYLVRHGEAAASWSEDPDPGLSTLGQQQAHSVAEQLAASMPADTQLISSPLARARETSLPLAQATNADVAISEIFTEVPSPVPLAQRQQWLRAFMTQQWYEQPEALQAWRNAILGGLRSLQRPAVVFTHFLVINTVVGSVLEQPATLCCWPDNGSITRLRLLEGRLALVALGEQMKTHVN